MGSLQFKTFLWPADPEEFREDCQLEPVYTKTNSGEYVFEGMGPLKRVISGKGSFFGTEAAAQFRTLEALLADTAPGTLSHPVWGARAVYFTGLQMQQPAAEDRVDYSFTFTEADSQGAIPK